MEYPYTINVTNPGQDPVEGDWIECHHSETCTECKQYHKAIEPVVIPELLLTLSVSKPALLRNDGTSTLAIEGELSFNGTTTLLDKTWYLPVRNSIGAVYDTIPCVLVNGKATINYSTKLPPEICSIRQADFKPLDVKGITYDIKLQEEITFMVYRS